MSFCTWTLFVIEATVYMRTPHLRFNCFEECIFFNLDYFGCRFEECLFFQLHELFDSVQIDLQLHIWCGNRVTRNCYNSMYNQSLSIHFESTYSEIIHKEKNYQSFIYQLYTGKGVRKKLQRTGKYISYPRSRYANDIPANKRRN